VSRGYGKKQREALAALEGGAVLTVLDILDRAGYVVGGKVDFADYTAMLRALRGMWPTVTAVRLQRRGKTVYVLREHCPKADDWEGWEGLKRRFRESTHVACEVVGRPGAAEREAWRLHLAANAPWRLRGRLREATEVVEAARRDDPDAEARETAEREAGVERWRQLTRGEPA
jgi:hypothetical protein